MPPVATTRSRAGVARSGNSVTLTSSSATPNGLMKMSSDLNCRYIDAPVALTVRSTVRQFMFVFDDEPVNVNCSFSVNVPLALGPQRTVIFGAPRMRSGLRAYLKRSR